MFNNISNQPTMLLAFDGGGVRGVFQTRILHRIEEARPHFLSQVGAIAGTSVGAIFAAGLSMGITPAAMEKVLLEASPKMFKRSICDRLSNPFGLFKSKYDNAVLKATLQNLFGTATIGDLKKPTLITTLALNAPPNDEYRNKSIQPQVYTNFGYKPSLSKPVWEACLESASAPLYLPVHNHHCDGGTFANNPSLSLISELIRAGGKLENYTLLSVGACYNASTVQASNAHWGAYQWFTEGDLVNVLLGEASTEAVHFYIKALLDKRYYRLQHYLSKHMHIMLDEVDQMPKVLKLATEYDLVPVLEWLDNTGR